MNKINKKALIIQSLVYIISLVISEFGIGCYYGCELGTDPISVFVDGVHLKTNLSYGDISTICNVILTILMFVFERKYLGISTIISMFIAGPLIDVFETLIRTSFPVATTSMFVRIIILLAGLITTGIGYGMTIACDLGSSPFQFCPIFVADKFKIDLKYAQIITDAIFFIIGFLMGGIVGVGSVVSVLLTGYILEYALAKTNKLTSKYGSVINE